LLQQCAPFGGAHIEKIVTQQANLCRMEEVVAIARTEDVERRFEPRGLKQMCVQVKSWFDAEAVLPAPTISL
jgi:hypothetical protein